MDMNVNNFLLLTVINFIFDNMLLAFTNVLLEIVSKTNISVCFQVEWFVSMSVTIST